MRALARVTARGQVLLLPNFALCVTRELRPLDGFGTIELLEQAAARASRAYSRKAAVCGRSLAHQFGLWHLQV